MAHRHVDSGTAIGHGLRTQALELELERQRSTNKVTSYVPSAQGTIDNAELIAQYLATGPKIEESDDDDSE